MQQVSGREDTACPVNGKEEGKTTGVCGHVAILKGGFKNIHLR